MKKLILTLIAIVTLFTTLTACTNNEKKDIDRLDGLKNNMSYQAVSSIKMLEIKEKFNDINRLSLHTLLDSKDVAEKEEIEKYLAMMEELMASNGGIDIVSEPSDKEEYNNKITITTKNLQNEEAVYLLYYNETVISEVEDDEDGDVEEVKKITGIAISNGKEYILEGETEIETENDEKEKETYFKIIEDENNYVLVKEEFEQGDFVY